MKILELKNIDHHFGEGKSRLDILSNINITVNNGEIIALVGQSGSGKSTMLQIAGLLANPSHGKIFINNENCTELSDKKRTIIRRYKIGFIYQFHHLLPEFSALENVMIPLWLAGKNDIEAARRANILLKSVGLSARIKHLPAELSGGERQRVAIARGLANNPALILADEPTGNLDPATGEKVFNYLCDAIKEQNSAAIIATHNMELASKADKILQMDVLSSKIVCL